MSDMLNVKLTEEEEQSASKLAAKGIRLATEWIEAHQGEDLVVLSHMASYFFSLLLVMMDDITVLGDMRLGRFVTEHDRIIHHVKSIIFYTDSIRSQMEPKKVDVQ